MLYLLGYKPGVVEIVQALDEADLSSNPSWNPWYSYLMVSSWRLKEVFHLNVPLGVTTKVAIHIRSIHPNMQQHAVKESSWMRLSHLNAGKNKWYRLLEINFWKTVGILVFLLWGEGNYEKCKNLSQQKQHGRKIRGASFSLSNTI